MCLVKNKNMVKLNFLLIVLCVGFVNSTVDDKWKKFKLNYDKVYYSEEEENRHFENFKQNLGEIRKHNELYKSGLTTYKKGITKFADLTGDQFTSIYGLPQGPLKTYISSNVVDNSTANGSECFDWRDKGAVTRVKDQGTCGSCWIFSAVGVLEGYHYRKTNKLITLSEQNMVDCISNRTCHGGWSPDVFDYLRDKGINKEEDYPYKGNSSKCRHDKSSRVKIDFESYEQVEEYEEAIKEAVIKHGPILVMLSANKHWKLYKSGVLYEDKCSEWTNHSILLVGFGRENGQDYWLLKNSWGKDWGEKGYIKFARNKHESYCGITESAYYLK